MLYLTYSETSSLTEDGVPLYRCTTTSKGSSYVYVCHGSDGIQKLEYSQANCTGVATIASQTSFEAFGEYYCSWDAVSSLPTCIGPSTF